MDDILVYAKDKAEHDARLKMVLDRLQESGVTLNSSKFEFAKTQLQYLGQVIDAEGVKKDLKKVKAIVEMKEPEEVAEVRRFLDMVNQIDEIRVRPGGKDETATRPATARRCMGLGTRPEGGIQETERRASIAGDTSDVQS